MRRKGVKVRRIEVSLHDSEGRVHDVPTTLIGPADAYARSERERIVRTAVDALPPRMAEIIRRRFGISGSALATQAQLAKELGVTRQRVQQIEQDALSRRLHHLLKVLE